MRQMTIQENISSFIYIINYAISIILTNHKLANNFRVFLI